MSSFYSSVHPSTRVFTPDDPDPSRPPKGVRGSQLRVNDDLSAAFTPPTWAGSVTSVCAVAAGDGISNRQSLRIIPHDIRVRVKLCSTGTYTNVTSQQMRLVLVQDLQQASDSPPIVDDLFESINDAGAPISFVHDKDVPGKFRVLDDQLLLFDDRSNVSQVVELRARKAKMLPIWFNGTASADIQKNGIYLIAVSSCNTSPTPANYWSDTWISSRLVYSNC